VLGGDPDAPTERDNSPVVKVTSVELIRKKDTVRPSNQQVKSCVCGQFSVLANPRSTTSADAELSFSNHIPLFRVYFRRSCEGKEYHKPRGVLVGCSSP